MALAEVLVVVVTPADITDEDAALECDPIILVTGLRGLLVLSDSGKMPAEAVETSVFIEEAFFTMSAACLVCC